MHLIRQDGRHNRAAAHFILQNYSIVILCNHFIIFLLKWKLYNHIVRAYRHINENEKCLLKTHFKNTDAYNLSFTFVKVTPSSFNGYLSQP